MSQKLVIEAVSRSDKGKGASRRLRHAGKFPAVVYGTGKDPVSLEIEHRLAWRAQQEESFYTQVLSLVIDGNAEDVIVKDMQRHPFKPVIMHIDFQRVDPNKAVHTIVPLHFVNEEAAAKKGGSVSHLLNELEVSCLPANLPEFIEVDLADIEVGQTLHISELKLPEGTTSVELAKGSDHDQGVVALVAPKGGATEEESAE